MTETTTGKALLARLMLRLNTEAVHEGEVAQTLQDAEALVKSYAASETPQTIQDLAALEVAAELWARRDAKGGIIAAFTDGPATRLARDPMVAAYPLLDPWRGVIFG